jgi:hypothetical protein
MKMVARGADKKDQAGHEMAIRFLSWQSLGIALAVALFGSIGGAIFYEMKRDDWAEPELKAMRAHRVSLMTDEQIRKLNSDAITDAIRFKKIDQEAREKDIKETAASNQRCSDVIYRERNSAECIRGISLGLFLYRDGGLTPTADQISKGFCSAFAASRIQSKRLV